MPTCCTALEAAGALLLHSTWGAADARLLHTLWPITVVAHFGAPQHRPCSCADESIDEIAAFLGVGEQVAALTAK